MQTEFEHVNEALLKRENEGDSKGYSTEAFRSHLEIVDDYAHLYDRYPDTFRRQIVADRYKMLGLVELDERGWSPTAIGAFLRANHVAPGLNTRCLQLLVASLFDRQGLAAGQWIKRRL
jgi:hypothetical protein